MNPTPLQVLQLHEILASHFYDTNSPATAGAIQLVKHRMLHDLIDVHQTVMTLLVDTGEPETAFVRDAIWTHMPDVDAAVAFLVWFKASLEGAVGERRPIPTEPCSMDPLDIVHLKSLLAPTRRAETVDDARAGLADRYQATTRARLDGLIGRILHAEAYDQHMLDLGVAATGRNFETADEVRTWLSSLVE